MNAAILIVILAAASGGTTDESQPVDPVAPLARAAPGCREETRSVIVRPRGGHPSKQARQLRFESRTVNVCE